MEHLIQPPDGIILVTGPTGCGKTTTLYACLNRINKPDVNILTAEDPVEYEIGGIHQVHVQPKIGLTFASALRAFFRQDPDVIMVGEIRDKETAEIAIHASLTGHLVLSTIHTNDAAGAVTRLVEMGVEPFLISSSLIGILAQRLVRMLCPKCRTAVHPDRRRPALARPRSGRRSVRRARSCRAGAARRSQRCRRRRRVRPRGRRRRRRRADAGRRRARQCRRGRCSTGRTAARRAPDRLHAAVSASTSCW